MFIHIITSVVLLAKATEIAYKIAINKYLNKWETPNIPVKKVEKPISTPTPKVVNTPIQTETKPVAQTEPTPATPETIQVTESSDTPIDTSNIEEIKSQLIGKVTNNTTKHNR